LGVISAALASHLASNAAAGTGALVLALGSLGLAVITKPFSGKTALTLRTLALLGFMTGLTAFVVTLVTGSAIVGLLLGLGSAAIQLVFADKLVLWSVGAVPAEEFVSFRPDLAEKVETAWYIAHELAGRAGVGEPRLVVVPEDGSPFGSVPNAFATGRRSKPVVGVTEALLKTLDDRELMGVLSHEIAHVKNRDVIVATVAAGMGAALGYALDPFLNSMFGDTDEEDLLILMLASLVASLVAMAVTAAISRAREYLADETGAKLCGDPLALASALEKIEEIASKGLKPSGTSELSTAHLWIVNPFKGFLVRLFSTHPPTEKRIERLMRLARELGGA